MIILISTIIDLAITIYYLSQGTTIVFQNIYYFTIILAAYWYKWRGALFSSALSAVYLALSAYYDPQFDPLFQAVIRSVIFVLISVVVAYLSIRLDNERNRYHTIFSKAESGMVAVLADDQKIKEANRRFQEITGDETVEGKKLEHYFKDKDAVNIEELQRTAQDFTDIEMDIISQSGETRTCLVSGSHIGPHELVISLVDVTDRNIMESRLRESEEKFRDIFNHANDGIQIHELTEGGALGRFVDINEVGCIMLGYSREEMLGLGPDDISTDYHDPPRDKILSDLRNTGKARFETGHRRKNGVIVPVEVNAHVVNLQGRRVVISVVRDISENKLTTNALKLANNKLNILSGITRHDIMNQIIVLTGNIELFEKKQLDHSSDRYLHKAEAAAENISTIIQFTKTYEDIGIQSPIWQEVEEMIEKCAEDIHLVDAKLVNDIPSGTEVFADPLIIKVFYNLMQNSIRHGGNIKTIHFYLEERDGIRTIICQDDGVGIPADMKGKLFTKGFGKDHGLGLFLSKEILSITGIDITEEGELRKGAKFVITPPKGGIRLT